jgi:hypothetical protein
MQIRPMRHALTSSFVAMTVLVAVFTAGCVRSEKRLLTGARASMGESFEAHFFENFVDGKASIMHTAYYRWTDGQYVLVRGSNHRVLSFTSIALDNENYAVEGTVKENTEYNYWVARKVVDGVFLIVPVNEADADDATRAAACTGKQVDGFCFVENQQDLIKLAKATASKALRDPTLGVLVLRRDGA